MAHTQPKKDTIPLELVSHHITCETNEKFLGYRDLVQMDAPVWMNSICNKLGRLSQILKAHAGTDTIDFIFHKDKLKDRRATYVRDVCNIRPKKTETHRTRLTAGGNLIYYPGYVRTPTSDLTTTKLHVNSAISDVTSGYMCMDVNIST